MRKSFELLTLPVMEPSAFCFQFERTGMLSFGAAFTGAFLAGAAAFGLEEAPPKNEKPEEAFFAGGAGGAAAFGAGFGFEPNSESVERKLVSLHK